MEEEIQDLQRIIDLVIDFFVRYAFQVTGAIIVLVVGWIAGRVISTYILRFLEKKKFDITLSQFIAGTVKLIVIAFAVIVSLGKFGISVAPFIAALAALAFGASFAIQGPLANYGAGLVIIFTRPFIVGNTITVAGVSGVVEEVKMGATILTDEDGVRITIPNKHVVGEILHNSEEWRIVEEVVGISYDSDPEAAIQITMQTLDGIDKVSKNPPPQVGIQKFGDSSIDIGFRYWVLSKKYFQTLYEVNLAVYKSLKESGVEIPYPQRDVHIVSQSAEVPLTASKGGGNRGS